MWKKLRRLKKFGSINKRMSTLQHVCWPLLSTLLQQLLHCGVHFPDRPPLACKIRKWKRQYWIFAHIYVLRRVHRIHTAAAVCYFVACRRWGWGEYKHAAVLPGASKTDSRVEHRSGLRRTEKAAPAFSGSIITFWVYST